MRSLRTGDSRVTRSKKVSFKVTKPGGGGGGPGGVAVSISLGGEGENGRISWESQGQKGGGGYRGRDLDVCFRLKAGVLRKSFKEELEWGGGGESAVGSGWGL